MLTAGTCLRRIAFHCYALAFVSAIGDERHVTSSQKNTSRVPSMSLRNPPALHSLPTNNRRVPRPPVQDRHPLLSSLRHGLVDAGREEEDGAVAFALVSVATISSATKSNVVSARLLLRGIDVPFKARHAPGKGWIRMGTASGSLWEQRLG
jgi:hypothetical protein